LRGSPLVEDFAYPGADAILAEHGLKLSSGGGHIEFVAPEDGACASGLVRVETMPDLEPFLGLYCFRTSGSRGFVTMEIPDTFRVRAAAEPLEATALVLDEDAPESEATEEVYQVRANRSVAIGDDNVNTGVSMIRTNGRTKAVYDIVYSSEHVNGVVDLRYRQMLGRPAITAEVTSSANALWRGGTVQQLLTRLVPSDEYLASRVRFPSLG